MNLTVACDRKNKPAKRDPKKSNKEAVCSEQSALSPNHEEGWPKENSSSPSQQNTSKSDQTPAAFSAPLPSGTNKSLPAANQEGTALFSVPRDSVGTGTGSGPREKERRWGDLGSE